MASAFSSASRLATVAAVVVQAPSGAASVSRRAADGRPEPAARQSFGLLSVGAGIRTILRHSVFGQGMFLPARSAGAVICCSQLGHLKVTVWAGAAAAAGFGSSAR